VIRSTIRLAAAALAVTLALSVSARAHPHVLVDAKAEIVFDDKGEITAIRHIWQFDEAFTAFAVQGLDANNDGKLSDAELEPLAKVNVESLAEFDFFTFLTVAGKDWDFVPPSEYWLEFHNARLTLFYTLPLKTPVVVNGKATLEIFDPEYFVAFSLVKDSPIVLDGAPAGCKTSIRLPGELDPATAAVLGAVPADERVLPPDLRRAASVLANVITIACPPAAPVDETMPVADQTAAVDVAAAMPAGEPDQAAPPTDAVAPVAGSGLNPLALIGIGLVLIGATGIAVIFVRRRFAR
jgi:ABC-type uncharacterized transport system substrate-binding protein